MRWRRRIVPSQQIEPPIVNGRAPPHDLDAEAAVLSAILLSREALDRGLEILQPEHFYSDANGRIYEAALALATAGGPVDVVEVASYLRARETLLRTGGAAYLAQLADATPAVAHVHAHAKTVREKWRLRALIATCQRVAAEGYGDVGGVQEFIDAAEHDIYSLAHETTHRDPRFLRDALRDRFQILKDAFERGDKLSGYATGWTRLDQKLGGLSVGNFTIIAARPSMGKTALATGLAVNLATPRSVLHEGGEPTLEPGYGVFVASLEMPEAQLVDRMICTEARVDGEKYRLRRLQPADWSRLAEAGSFMASLPIVIDETPAISVLDLRAKVRRFQAEYNREAIPADPERGIAGVPERKVAVVMVDYLQLMRGPEGIDSREQEIGEVSRGLKGLAKDLQVHVIALAQLNRAVETRSTKDKRPQLSDLRESGQIEQDADTIIFIYRDEYYNPETSDARGIAELIVAKARFGKTGKVLMRFTGSCGRFDELARGDYPEIEDG